MKIEEISKELEKKCNARLVSTTKSNEFEITTLLTDSRNLFKADETLFFAIKSKQGNDGHNYIKTLNEHGVKNFVVQYIPDNIKDIDDVNIFLVPDVIEALSCLGRLNISNAEKIVAITGSRGKTTLKEMINRLLDPICKTARSPRSFNSKIGVPLSLWQIPPSTDIAIIEAGISKKGEMANLMQLIQPNTVIFTNIDQTHDDGFSSKKEKTLEKVILASDEITKTIIYPSDNIFLKEALKTLPQDKHFIDWSLKDKFAKLYVEISETQNSDRKTLTYKWKDKIHAISVPCEEMFDIENAISALAFLLSENLETDIISQRFASLLPVETKIRVTDGINGCSLILDPYQSDLTSLTPALDFMHRRKMNGQSPTLILSDLSLEGSDEADIYKKLSELIKEGGIKKFIGIGESLIKYRDFFDYGSRFYKDTTDFLKKVLPSDFTNEIILLKGNPEYKFEDIYNQFASRKHETVLEVNLDAIVRNYDYFRSLIPSTTGIVAMVKAFGYGVGSKEIAKTLQDCGASYLAVAVLDEGVELRNNGITMPIMVMNPRSTNYKTLFAHSLEPVAYSISMLNELIDEAKKCGLKNYPVHLKLDTGMHRMGFLPEQLPDVITLLRDCENLRVKSIFSHLATADCLDMDDFTLSQINQFEKMSETIIQSLGYNIKRHILNSVGIVRFPKYHFDMVRLGIGLYGINTLPSDIEKPLSTVATLRSPIICIREILPGEAVGYGRKSVAKRLTKVATIPLGYADGMNRHYGNGSIKVKLNGKEAPTIGNICMDATMIDVTDIDCKEGDVVEVFGNELSVQRLADRLDTIPYEILTSISPRVKRIYFRE